MAYISFQPNDYFNTKIYSGTGSSNALTGVGFQPDFTWIKARSTTYSHTLTDAVRGVTKHNASNNSNAEYTSTTEITSFNSDGFTVGTDSGVNNGSHTFASWNWKANGQGSSNTDGGINTTYTSANTTSGFSIVTWTGTGSASSIGHGLGVKPSMVILKSRSNTYGWYTWHKGLSSEMNKYLRLDGNGSVATDTSAFGSTAPTTTVFPIGTGNAGTNSSGHTYVAYCFAEKQGFSKFGSYTGNGNDDGSFIFTGFKPAFILVKNAAITDNWSIFDNKRIGYNAFNYVLYADITNVGSNGLPMDILSNGFKWRTSAAMVNGSGNNCIYMAFAESPIVSSNGVPAVAR